MYEYAIPYLSVTLCQSRIGNVTTRHYIQIILIRCVTPNIEGHKRERKEHE